MVTDAVNVPRGTKKKPPNAGIGRKKGVANKRTREVREVIARVAEANAEKIDGWLARIGRKNPAKAMELYLRMLEYHIPKLTRTEIVKDDKPNGRVIDSSQLTAEQREQLRRMILAQAEPALLEQQPSTVANFIDTAAREPEPVGLSVAQVVDSTD